MKKAPRSFHYFLNTTRTLLIASLATLPLAPAVSAAPADAAAKSQRPALPNLQLNGPLRGAAAIQALGAQLPDVAAHHRLSAERLTQILQQDRTAWIDRRGKLFYIEEFAPVGADSGTANATTAAALDLAQTFLLHSKPGAQRVIYLDFNGHSVSNTAWNSGTINAEPFDADGNPGSFSDAEKQTIQNVWQRVAEDYAPFDVDVTTEEPALDRLRRTSSSDTLYGTRVVVTRDTFYNCGCGGVAYVGTFDNYSSTNPDYYQPAWVFYNGTGANAKGIAEAATHEAGHNLGLNHDGTSSTGYYSGHGSGTTGWAPIMGAGYYREVTQWSRGEYPNANNTEDDLAIIPANGVPVRGDDAGDSLGTAVPLAGSGGSVSQAGVIQSPADVDVYSFVTTGGSVSLAIDPVAIGANLDIAANLYNASGTLLAQSNPVDALNATLTTTVPAGTYYLSIGGGGKGDLASGYPDYGSLGQYRVSGSYAGSGAVAPVAVASATPTSGLAPLNVSFTGSGSTDSDGSIVAYAWNFGDGTTASTANPLKTYGTPGSYSARLTVTDSQGLTNTASVGITVNAATPALRVGNIGISVARSLVFYYQCTATVTVTNASGTALANATVTGAWSGVTASSTSARTGANGVATLRSPLTSRRGTCTFTVNGVSLSGYSYTPALNAESFDSLTY
jgi:PKD repeat protein